MVGCGSATRRSTARSTSRAEAVRAREPTASLRSGQARRQSRYLLTARKSQGRGQITDMVLISERPAEVEDRAVPGHLGGDLLVGARKPVPDRCPGRALNPVRGPRLSPGGAQRPIVRDAVTTEIVKPPSHLRRSLTWDRGKEMAEHRLVPGAAAVAPAA